ncbi:MAG TPA: aminotransferase class I/II-fold pyridoxal phosphate-dependent enzyme, partial [Prochlorococcus sp.]
GVNTGTISAYMEYGTYVIVDELVHTSIWEGARLSKAKILIFKHNDMRDLKKILNSIKNKNVRKLICCEGVYSADGDKANLKDIVKLAKKYHAKTLVDEAHSIMVAGQNGRGVSEELGILEQVDFFILTFSKAFCALGGALIAKKELTRYVDWFAKNRMFSAGIPPSVVGGIIKALDLGSSLDGQEKRIKIMDNAKLMMSLLKDKINILDSESWIIPIMYYDEKITLKLSDFLQRNGMDAGMMSYPSVPHNQARIRLFVTSEHTKEQIREGSIILIKAAKAFNFLK